MELRGLDWLNLDWLNQDWQPSAKRDAVTAAILTAIPVYAAYSEAHPTDPSGYFTGRPHLPHAPDAAFLLAAACAAVLAWRHRYPRLVLCASAGAVVAYSLSGWVDGVMPVMPALALGTLATMVPATRAIAWAVGLLVVLGGASVVNNPLGTFGGGVMTIPFTLAVALLAGIAVANRRAYGRSLRDRAAQEARRQVDEERLRIARELHDVVAHTMATITVQGAAAAPALRSRPEDAAQSLAPIRAASKTAPLALRA